MKLPRSISILIASISSASASDIPLEFDLQSHENAVALQFDVAATPGASIQLAAPTITLTSPHVLDWAVMPSGATRYVVYSTVGQKISPSGKLRVSFSASRGLSSGMIAISGVVASDGTGQLVPAPPNAPVAPNALPVLSSPQPDYRSAETGRPANLTAPVVDLDGTVASVDFRIGGISRGVLNAPPFTLAWAPTAPGSFPFALAATDNRGATVTFNLGTLRTFNLSDINTFAAYGDIHYGPAANPGAYAFDADPLHTGTANGIGYLLGLNPHSPDRTRLPRVSVEFSAGQYHLVLRFVRRTSAPGVNWSVRESSLLSAWATPPNAPVTETPLAGGLTEVTVRRPLGLNPPANHFVQLRAAR